VQSFCLNIVGTGGTGSAGCSLTPTAASSSAAFTAATAGVYQVTAAAAADPAKSATITVDVHDGVLMGSGSGAAVTGLDILCLAGKCGTVDVAADFNGDGTVDSIDLAILLRLLGW